MGVQSLGWEDSLEKSLAAHPVLLPGESHGQRSLVATAIGSHRVEHDWSDLACMHKQCKGKYGFTLHIFITFFSPQVKSWDLHILEI